MTYVWHPAAPGTLCDECGDPATVCLVADGRDADTGYQDQKCLCDVCAESVE